MSLYSQKFIFSYLYRNQNLCFNSSFYFNCKVLVFIVNKLGWEIFISQITSLVFEDSSKCVVFLIYLAVKSATNFSENNGEIRKKLKDLGLLNLLKGRPFSGSYGRLIFSIYSFYYLFFCSQTFFPKKSH
jgi:hypothetical protein